MPCASFLRCCALLPLLVFASAWGEPQVVTCELTRGRLVAQVEIGGRGGFAALLDAGIMAPVVSHDVLAATGADQDAQGAAAVGAVVLAPRLRMEEVTAAVGDLSGLGEVLGTRVDALLPLHQPALEVTLEAAQARVTYRPLDEAELGAPGGGTQPMRLGDGTVPLVQVLLDGKYQREVALDLAFPGVALFTEATLNDLGLLAKDPPALRTRNGDGQASVQFRLSRLRLGTTDLESPICEMGPGPDRLGLGALQHFALTLNFEAGLVRWTSIAGPSVPPAPLIGHGLALHRLRGGQWELAVAEGSPASEAGIQPGALLAGVGGTPLRGAGHATAGRLLFPRPDGAPTAVTVIQSGAPLEAVLASRELL